MAWFFVAFTSSDLQFVNKIVVVISYAFLLHIPRPPNKDIVTVSQLEENLSLKEGTLFFKNWVDPAPEGKTSQKHLNETKTNVVLSLA